MAMVDVDVDGSCQFSADSQPKSIGLVRGLAVTRRSVTPALFPESVAQPWPQTPTLIPNTEPQH